MKTTSLIVLLSIVSVAWGLSCYQCNSGAHGQANCSSSEATDLAKWKKPCGKLNDGKFANKPALGCRKIAQSVESKEQIIRECAFSGENVDGQKKTGNMGIQLYYYQCSTDACNGSTSISFLSTLMAFVLSLVVRN